MNSGEQGIGEYLAALMASPRLGKQVVCHRVLPQADAHTAPNRRPWPAAIRDLLSMQGIDELYAHQALATDIIRSGRHVVVATPTASGKTLVYNLPVIERFLHDKESRALYLFPLKALAQDQLKNFRQLTAHWPKEARPQAAIYDGDTTPHFRRKIRQSPPAVLMTNPEMLHLSILPHHEQWAVFLASLQYIVVDEVHTYRGVLGSHMAQLFRRLLRICALYGIAPTFIFCSATVGNPGELCRQLTGLPEEHMQVVTQSGAPQGKRHFVFLNPEESPSTAAIQLLQSALARGLRTIVYTQSRKMTELISVWVGQKSGPFRERISAYRAGFLPEERREIEARMNSGDLLAVITTSALELGIDIGSLDLCILVGYPGTVMSTLQRGGRVGRATQESAVVLVAGEDALDQYFMRHPHDFFERPAEHAVLNPFNPVILKRHLECAAAERSLRTGRPANRSGAAPSASPEDDSARRDAEPWLQLPPVQAALAELEAEGLLLRDAEGTTVFAARKRPHRHVDLRGAGSSIHIQTGEGTVIGSVDGIKALRETHPGAVYLHKGETWIVTALDLEARTATVTAPPGGRVDYYTRVRGNKETEILEVLDQKNLWGTRISLGRLRVTETVTGFEKRNTRGGTLLGITPLSLPPQVFETEGLWFEIPMEAQRATEDAFLHFMGSIHALEHAAIGMLPLLVMTDRNDLGGISTPMHAQVGKPAVFIYDGMPGGAGLTRLAFSRADEMFASTLAAIRDCGCELGCPSCVHSPKCGSGNRPIDKAGALFLLGQLEAHRTAPHTVADAPTQIVHTSSVIVHPSSTRPQRKYPPAGLPLPALPEPEKEPTTPARYAVLDVETRRSAQEVGGWNKAERMGVSVAVLYDSAADTYTAYTQDRMPEMLNSLADYDLIVGFNILRFDYRVLSAFTTRNLSALPTLDMLDVIRKRLSYRVSLDNLGSATFNAPKSADGLQALRWWKEGKVDEIARYCEQDVRITRNLYLHGRDHGYVLFTNKSGQKVRIPVDWK